jgi:ubiquinone/menaquinone biosynthesis C-methylase UbiE
MSNDKSIFMLELYKQASGQGKGTLKAYDEIYDTHGIRQLDSFYLWLLGLLKPAPGSRFLDVSCGEGVLSQFALRYNLNAHGIDQSRVAIRKASSESAATYLVGDGERLPYGDNSFDYVTNIGSLEHFVDMPAGVQEMVRVLGPQGTALILLPNTYSLFGNILSAFKFGVTYDDGQPIQRYAALNEWRQLLENNGLEVVQVIKYERERPRSWQDLRWYLARPKSFLRMLLTPAIPLNLAWCFVYICKPAQTMQTCR